LTLSDDDYDNRIDADFGNETAIKCATVHTTVPVGGVGKDDLVHVQPVIDRLPATLTDDQRKCSPITCQYLSTLCPKKEAT